MLMRLTTLFYNFGLNIIAFETVMKNNIVSDIFTLETEDDDYYLFERLESRIKFEIPEITEVKLLEEK